MVGLERYIEKHGKHFTVELAYRAMGNRWSAKEIYDYLQKKVYYNVSGTTLGDMVYLFNRMYSPLPGGKEYSRDNVISYVQDIQNLNFPALFELWLLSGKNEDINLNEFV